MTLEEGEMGAWSQLVCPSGPAAGQGGFSSLGPGATCLLVLGQDCLLTMVLIVGLLLQGVSPLLPAQSAGGIQCHMWHVKAHLTVLSQSDPGARPDDPTAP